jgi:primosomal protein N'
MAEDQNNSCLIAEVIIDQNIPLVLSYEVPIELQDKINIGCRCQIPFRSKTLKGFVFSLGVQTPTQKLIRLLGMSFIL